MYKAGFVAIVGKPNVGKSSFLNKVVGEKISITTPKPQTTRFDIRGIVTSKTSQIVFIDTPGAHIPKHKLGKYMQKGISDASQNADIVLYMVDATRYKLDQISKETLNNLAESKIPTILCINKIDVIQKSKILNIIQEYNEYVKELSFSFCEILPISVYNNDGIDILLNNIEKHLPESEMIYPEDEFTDASERQIVEETIREKLLRYLKEEVPHGVNVIVNSFKESESKCMIDVDIVCMKQSHKAIIIGKDGSMIKRIKIQSKKEIEKTLDKKITLNLWVKVRKNWQEDDNYLKNIKDKI